jgi:hypothetical protein
MFFILMKLALIRYYEFQYWPLRTPQGPTIVGLGNGTLEVPELPNAWGYSWATLSPVVINTER